MPVGSHSQLLKFLDDLEISYKFFDSHADTQPAPTVKRKLQRHWNKLKSEYILLRYLRKFDLQNSIVHIELTPWQSFLALTWLASKTQVFVTLHTSILPIPKLRYWLWQAKFRGLAKFKNFHIFTGNQDAKNSLKMLVPKKFFEKITVTPSFVNLSEVEKALQSDRAEVREKYGLPTDKLLVFCVGRFSDLKGRWVFLEAAKKLLEKNRELAFVWISNNTPSAEDLQKASDYGIGADFILITADRIGQAHVDLFKLLRLADIFALPSFLEGLPFSLIEAMGLGIPSIATNINGVPEAVKHLETGFLIEVGSSAALTSAIQTLKDDKPLREKLAKNGREFVSTNFGEKVVAEIAVKKYIEALRVK